MCYPFPLSSIVCNEMRPTVYSLFSKTIIMALRGDVMACKRKAAGTPNRERILNSMMKLKKKNSSLMD